MGNMTEMIMEGAFCQNCGDYIGEPCGYPISCEECEGEEQ